MTAALNQDFVTYQGDTISPIFTVINSASTPVDISSVTEITWNAMLEGTTTPLLSKTKSGGQIVFVTNGSDGKFQVNILSADTQPLSGYYMHKAALTDGNNHITTVEVGRMQVGVEPTWTYNPAAVSVNPVYQVRRLIGDVLYGDQQMQDDEIQFYIDNYSNVWTAAANAARALAAQFGRMVDTVQGDLRTMYGQRVRNYLSIASTLEMQGKGRGTSYVYAGAISISDKSAQAQDTDRTPPQFNLMLFDNLLPTTPVGQQVPGARLPDMPSVP